MLYIVFFVLGAMFGVLIFSLLSLSHKEPPVEKFSGDNFEELQFPQMHIEETERK